MLLYVFWFSISLGIMALSANATKEPPRLQHLTGHAMTAVRRPQSKK
jgi:hypothetical protein